MSRRTRMSSAFLAAVGFAVAAPSVSAEVVWLCKPGLADNPCEGPLDTTIREPDGSERVETPPRDPHDARPIDCFYVYPTVSNQATPNATKARDPELLSVAKAQAARFSARCRIFAPIYRQTTLAGLVTGVALGEGDPQIAYADVREAWREYLADHNDGRGVVLIGHSQGTFMLRRLLAQEIEPGEHARRIVSALLLGGNVAVKPGDVLGGDFSATPLCTREAQVRCVVAYSTFAADPPETSTFGRPSATAGESQGVPARPGTAVACTDPRPLAGERGPLRLLVPTQPFAPGVLLAGRIFMFGPPPSAPTTWATYPDRFEGACRRINGAHVLRYDPLPGSRRPNFFPEPGWGTHSFDYTVTLDPLLELVRKQARRWVAPDLRLARRCTGGRLRMRIDGDDMDLVRAVRFRTGGRTLRDARAPFARTLRRSRGRTLTAIVVLSAGESQRVTLRRAAPRCS